jgi:hypothetical protein
MVYESEPLEGDVTIMGLIDVDPGDMPGYNAPPPAPGAPPRAEPANTIRMGGY